MDFLETCIENVHTIHSLMLFLSNCICRILPGCAVATNKPIIKLKKNKNLISNLDYMSLLVDIFTAQLLHPRHHKEEEALIWDMLLSLQKKPKIALEVLIKKYYMPFLSQFH